MEMPYSPLDENFESEENLASAEPIDENARGQEPPFDTDSDTVEPETDFDDTEVEATSSKFLQTWQRLVSTTNWEKGRIILQWRESLVASGAPVSVYSDDAWSRYVGNVTPQHVGRLRRVYQRFNESYSEYDGLFWSHFQAAVDWDDAEMWLEGAVQGGWSVAKMRKQRWEALGAPDDQRPRDEDIIVAEVDEDVSADDDPRPSETVAGQVEAVHGPEGTEFPGSGESGPDAENGPFDSDTSESAMSVPSSESATATAEAVRPFEEMPELPDDLSEAVETMKVTILHHKMEGWRDVSCDDVLMVLSALKQMAMAPSDV